MASHKERPAIDYTTISTFAHRGLSIGQIAKTLGTSRTRVNQWVTDCAPDLSAVFHATDEIRRNELAYKRARFVVRATAEGLTKTQIARKLGITLPAFANWRRRNAKILQEAGCIATCSIPSHSLLPLQQ